MLDREPNESQVDTWQVIKSQLCPHVGGSALGQMETVTVEVQRRQTAIITGLMARTNDAMGSNYRHFWQLLTTTPASPAPGTPSNRWRPVEDIVSFHKVSSLDSLQEAMVHCTQLKGLAVHGASKDEWLYWLCSLTNLDGANIWSHDCLINFVSLFCVRVMFYSSLLVYHCLYIWEEQHLKPSAKNNNITLDIVFTELSSKC